MKPADLSFFGTETWNTLSSATPLPSCLQACRLNVSLISVGSSRAQSQCLHCDVALRVLGWHCHLLGMSCCPQEPGECEALWELTCARKCKVLFSVPAVSLSQDYSTVFLIFPQVMWSSRRFSERKLPVRISFRGVFLSDNDPGELVFYINSKDALPKKHSQTLIFKTKQFEKGCWITVLFNWQNLSPSWHLYWILTVLNINFSPGNRTFPT